MLLTKEIHHNLPDTVKTVPLETWADAMQRLSSVTERYLLEKVEHFKELSHMEHEFLVVYASRPSGSKIVLGIDRNAQNSVRSLSTLVCAKSPLSSPPSSPLSEKGSPHLAYDRVQISRDGTPAPILAHHGPHVQLFTITFSPTSASTSFTSSNSDARRLPSLLHLSVLLLAIRKRFPYYTLLKYQCYFFARATCLTLLDLFGGVATELEEGKRAATWRGVHVSAYSARCTALREELPLVMAIALQNMLLLPLAAFPVLMVPAVVYSAVKFYDGKAVEGEVDRRRIR